MTFRQFDGGKDPNAVMIAKSTDCGNTFAPPVLVTPFTENDAQDQSAPEPMPQPQSQRDDPFFHDEAGSEAGSSTARDCGDFSDACTSGYTFFRRDTQVRSTADQLDSTGEWVYIVYDATKPGTETATTSTYHTMEPGEVGQAATFFVRYNGANASHTTPVVIDNQSAGHQIFPDISADGGVLHAIWWDSRLDCVLQRREADRELRQSHDGAVARRLRGEVDGSRNQLDGQDARHRRDYEPELGAVRRSFRSIRRRLPLGVVARRHRLCGVDGLPQHGEGDRSS